MHGSYGRLRNDAIVIEHDIPRQRAKGKYVVAEYSGLHFIGYSTHSDEAEANAKACAIGLKVGHTSKVFNPTNESSKP